jgi:hypothetical protein
MTTPNDSPVPENPLQDPNYDPFSPEIDRAITDDGHSVVRINETLRNYGEAMQPRLGANDMLPGDQLTIDMDDQTGRTYVVNTVHAESLDFGSDDILSPKVAMTDTRTGESTVLQGSSILPNGVLLTPSRIMTGWHLNTVSEAGRTIDSATISSFSLKRPDADGALKDVRLNTSEKVEESESFKAITDEFKKAEELMAADGYRFDQPSKTGVFDEKTSVYKRRVGNTFVYADDQGLGRGSTPQHQIYTYDAKQRVMRAMRHIPSEGMMQVAILRGVSKELFNETQMYGEFEKSTGIDSSHFHRLASHVPFVTYTWLSPDTTTPITSIEFDSVLGGSMLTESRTDELPVDLYPSYFKADIVQDAEGPVLRPKASDWIKDKPAFIKAMGDAASIGTKKGNLYLKFGNYDVHIPTSPLSDSKELVKQLQRVNSQKPAFAGKSVIGKMIPRRHKNG